MVPVKAELPSGATPPDDITVTASGSNDDLVFEADPDHPGNLRVRGTTGTPSTMESVHFTAPNKTLTIDLGAGNDTLTLSPLGMSLAAKISLKGGDGADSVIVAIPGAISLTDTTLTVGADAMSVTGIEMALSGVPSWTEQGPDSITGGIVEGLGNDPVAGAVQAIAVHPYNKNVIFVGSVNGGVLRNVDGGTTRAPLTHPITSLSISAPAVI